MKIHPGFIPPTSAALGLLTCLAALFLTNTVRADDTRVILSVELTPAGEKIATPTPGHPIYYHPVYLGYKEMGPVLDFYERKPASEDAIRRSLTEALAKQGYLPAADQFVPSVVLTFQWGTLAPFKSSRSLGSSELSSGPVASLRPERGAGNADEIHDYTVGNGWRDVSRLDPNGKEILALTPRHFLLITALDFPAYTRRQTLTLWRAHASMNVWDHYLDEVMGTLITTATPLVGRSLQPMIISAPIVSAGFLLTSNPPATNSAAARLASRQP